MQEGSRRAIVAAFLANLGIAVSKFVAFLFTGAASMLAESIHSLADTSNQGLLMLGGRRARRPPDAKHPFGYARARYFWAFIVALVLFSVGGVFAIFQGVERLRNPSPIESAQWAFGVLGVSLVLESLSLRTALRESRHVGRAPRSFLGFVRRAKVPELPVVLLEDTGALLGLVFAMAGVILAEVTGNDRWDALGSLAIGVLLVSIAALLAVEMGSLLLGEAVGDEESVRVRHAIEASPSVRRIIHLRAVHLGPDDVLVAAKLEFDPTLTIARLAAAIDVVEVEIRAALPEARLVFIEPDLYRPSVAPSVAPSVESPADE